LKLSEEQAIGGLLLGADSSRDCLDRCRRPFGDFIDFSIGDFVTISDGNPNLGSNPTAIITNIDLETSSITPPPPLIGGGVIGFWCRLHSKEDCQNFDYSSRRHSTSVRMSGIPKMLTGL
jgi:hypothetical protein